MTLDSRIARDYSNNASLLGIDIGSVTISLVRMDFSGQILETAYLFHKGQIRECLRTAGEQLDLSSVRNIAVCAAPCFNPEMVTQCNPQVAVIKATKILNNQARSLLLVGAEKFMLIKFDEIGNFESVRSNSSCAAGTGSFLDQQAFRLNLTGVEELCEIALRNIDPVPDIASRCSVFAKTDLIHAQQLGYSLEAICDSLCKGLAINIVDSLFNQEIPLQPFCFAGGVSKNTAVVRHLEKLLKTPILINEYSHCMGAIGACYFAIQDQQLVTEGSFTSLDEVLQPDNTGKVYFHHPLALTLSEYPDFRTEKSWSFKPVMASHPLL